MPVNYQKMAATADRLVRENGRLVKFLEYSDVPKDASRPWLGPTAPAASAQELEAYAVLVSPSSVLNFKLRAMGLGSSTEDFLKRYSQVLIVGSIDIANYDAVVVDSKRWTVEAVEILKPANTLIMSLMALRQ